jgi:hypothetical protein
MPREVNRSSVSRTAPHQLSAGPLAGLKGAIKSLKSIPSFWAVGSYTVILSSTRDHPERDTGIGSFEEAHLPICTGMEKRERECKGTPYRARHTGVIRIQKSRNQNGMQNVSRNNCY